MAKNPRFTPTFAPEALEHLDGIERKYHTLLQREVDEQLSFEPDVATRNRKPLEQPAPFGAAWELRCGPQNRFRVFYDVDARAITVTILAFGVKVGNRLFFGGEEFQP